MTKPKFLQDLNFHFSPSPNCTSRTGDECHYVTESKVLGHTYFINVAHSPSANTFKLILFSMSGDGSDKETFNFSSNEETAAYFCTRFDFRCK